MGVMDVSDLKIAILNDNPDVITNEALEFTVPLADVTNYTIRQAQLASYSCATDGSGNTSWTELSHAEALVEVGRRYPDVTDTDGMGMVNQLYLTYEIGFTNIMFVNNQIADVGLGAPEGVLDNFVDDTTVTMPEYVKKVYQLDSMYSSLDTRGLANGLRDWSKDILYSIGNTAFIDLDIFAAYVGTIIYFAIRNYVMGVKVGRFMNDAVEITIANDLELGSNNELIGWDFVGDSNIEDNIRIEFQIGKVGGNDFDRWTKRISAGITVDEVKQARASSGKAMKRVTGAVAVLITAAFITATWVEFAANTKDVSNSQRDFARMQAWVTTFLLSLQLIISLLLIAFAS
ncbi:MAG: hypothetical protein GY761_12870, partial [Hyphomicrobiales bacterium]|nr:hypothetical protein [Hyphomicrobiales bacterium]